MSHKIYCRVLAEKNGVCPAKGKGGHPGRLPYFRRFLFQRRKIHHPSRNTPATTTMEMVSLGAGAHTGMALVGSIFQNWNQLTSTSSNSKFRFWPASG